MSDKGIRMEHTHTEDLDGRERVDDSDKDSFSASPLSRGLPMLWKGHLRNTNPLDFSQTCDDMSPVIPTFAPTRRRSNSVGTNDVPVKDDNNDCSTVIHSEDEQSEILIPLKSMNVQSTCESYVRSAGGGTLEDHGNTYDEKDRNLNHDNGSVRSVDSHTTMGSLTMNGQKENSDENSQKTRVSSFGLDCSDDENDDEITQCDNVPAQPKTGLPNEQNHLGIQMLGQGYGPVREKYNDQRKTIAMTGRKSSTSEEKIIMNDEKTFTEKLSMKGSIEKGREEDIHDNDLHIMSTSQDSSVEVSQSQSLIDPQKKILAKATKRRRRHLSGLSVSPGQASSSVHSSPSSCSSDTDIRAREEALYNHHSLEMDLMDKLEKHHVSARRLLQRGSHAVLGQVHKLLTSLAPLMGQLRTAHGRERKNIQSERGKKLKKQQITLLKIQVGLLVDREKRLVQLNQEHSNLTQLVKEGIQDNAEKRSKPKTCKIMSQQIGSDGQYNDQHNSGSQPEINSTKQKDGSIRYNKQGQGGEGALQASPKRNSSHANVAKNAGILAAVQRKKEILDRSGYQKASETFTVHKLGNTNITKDGNVMVNSKREVPPRKRQKKCNEFSVTLDQKKNEFPLQMKDAKDNIVVAKVNSVAVDGSLEIDGSRKDKASGTNLMQYNSSPPLSPGDTASESLSMEITVPDDDSYKACSQDKQGNIKSSNGTKVEPPKKTVHEMCKSDVITKETAGVSVKTVKSQSPHDEFQAGKSFIDSGECGKPQPSTIYIVTNPSSLLPKVAQSGNPSGFQIVANQGNAPYNIIKNNKSSAKQSGSGRTNPLNATPQSGLKSDQYLVKRNETIPIETSANMEQHNLRGKDRVMPSKCLVPKAATIQESNLVMPHVTNAIPPQALGKKEDSFCFGSQESRTFRNVIIPSNKPYTQMPCMRSTPTREIIKTGPPEQNYVKQQVSYGHDLLLTGTGQNYARLGDNVNSCRNVPGFSAQNQQCLSRERMAVTGNIQPNLYSQISNRGQESLLRKEILKNPATVTEQKAFVQTGKKSNTQSMLYPDLSDLLKAQVINPGEKILTMEVQGRTCKASLTVEGWIRGEGGEIFRTPMTWYKALNPDAHKLVVTKKLAYPKFKVSEQKESKSGRKKSVKRKHPVEYEDEGVPMVKLPKRRSNSRIAHMTTKDRVEYERVANCERITQHRIKVEIEDATRLEEEQRLEKQTKVTSTANKKAKEKSKATDITPKAKEKIEATKTTQQQETVKVTGQNNKDNIKNNGQAQKSNETDIPEGGRKSMPAKHKKQQETVKVKPVQVSYSLRSRKCSESEINKETKNNYCPKELQQETVKVVPRNNTDNLQGNKCKTGQRFQSTIVKTPDREGMQKPEENEETPVKGRKCPYFPLENGIQPEEGSEYGFHYEQENREATVKPAGKPPKANTLSAKSTIVSPQEKLKVVTATQMPQKSDNITLNVTPRKTVNFNVIPRQPQGKLSVVSTIQTTTTSNTGTRNLNVKPKQGKLTPVHTPRTAQKSKTSTLNLNVKPGNTEGKRGAIYTPQTAHKSNTIPQIVIPRKTVIFAPMQPAIASQPQKPATEDNLARNTGQISTSLNGLQNATPTFFKAQKPPTEPKIGNNKGHNDQRAAATSSQPHKPASAHKITSHNGPLATPISGNHIMAGTVSKPQQPATEQNIPGHKGQRSENTAATIHTLQNGHQTGPYSVSKPVKPVQLSEIPSSNNLVCAVDIQRDIPKLVIKKEKSQEQATKCTNVSQHKKTEKPASSTEMDHNGPKGNIKFDEINGQNSSKSDKNSHMGEKKINGQAGTSNEAHHKGPKNQSNFDDIALKMAQECGCSCNKLNKENETVVSPKVLPNSNTPAYDNRQPISLSKRSTPVYFDRKASPCRRWPCTSSFSKPQIIFPDTFQCERLTLAQNFQREQLTLAHNAHRPDTVETSYKQERRLRDYNRHHQTPSSNLRNSIILIALLFFIALTFTYWPMLLHFNNWNL